MKNNLNLILIILILLAIGCACPKSDETYSTNSTRTNSSPTALLSSTPTASPKKNISTKKGKTATVISENANLRKTANAAGEVIETLSEGSSIEVIKQKGAWFYVLAGENKGWIHGNTIRLDTSEKTSDSPTYPTNPVSKKTPTYETPTRSVNPSGATAKCRDGTLSYSAHRRGTCSHHGGVAEWY